MEVGWRRGMGRGCKFSLRIIKIDRGQRKCYIELMWYLPQVDLNKLYAVLELMGACYWEEVGGWLC